MHRVWKAKKRDDIINSDINNTPLPLTRGRGGGLMDTGKKNLLLKE